MIKVIIDSMANLEEDILYAEVQRALEKGVNANRIIASLQAGLDIVGERFEAQEYFLSELIMSSDLFNEASAYLGEDAVDDNSEKIGTFLIGTVETDIHDIGKNIVASVMKSNGFKVIDIGVDVPSDTFVQSVIDNKPHVIGLSCLLTTCFDSMKKTITSIRENGLDKGRLILIGGGPIDDGTVKYVGADARCTTAQAAVIASRNFIRGEYK